MDLNLIIKAIRKHLGLSQEDFANNLGITRSNLSQMEIGRNTPSVILLNDIANKFHIDIRVVFQMINAPEENLLHLLPLLSNGKEDGKEDGNPTPDSTPESGKTKSAQNNVPENVLTNVPTQPIFSPESGKTKSTTIVEIPIAKSDNPDLIGIPVVDISVAAGNGYENPDYLSEVDAIYFPRTMMKSGDTYLCVRIKGESMTPTLQDGGYLVIRLLDRSEWANIHDGHVYVVSDRDGRSFVKRLKNRLSQHGFIVCMSDNPDVTRFRNFNLSEDELNTVWHAEWYVSAKMPNIHTTYYSKVGELEDKYDDVINQLQQIRRDIRALSQPS